MSDTPPPVSDQPVLKLLNVESAYGPIKAIRGVSLQVRRSEIATVLGSNGAGKTTILKTISGIIDPRKGSIEFKGERHHRQRPGADRAAGPEPCARGARGVPAAERARQPADGRLHPRDRDGVARDMEAVYGYFPILKERAAKTRACSRAASSRCWPSAAR
jgi:branched-chain amino acid transport system ATP-binding protein